MFVSRAPQALAFIPVAVVALLVAESHSFPAQHASLQNINSDFGTTELGLSIAVNQMALLRILDEPPRRKTYKVYKHSVTHPQAVQACKQLGGRIALPMNKEEDKEIDRLIGVHFDGWTLYWISGTDQENEGSWIDDVTGKPLDYTNFKTSQPDNKHGSQHCMAKSADFTEWDDAGCSDIGEGYVCEFMDV